MSVEVIKDLVEVVKDPKVMFVLSLVIIVTSVVQRYFEVDLMLAIGVGLFAISGPMLIYRWNKERKNRAYTYNSAEHQRIMSEAQKALDRSREFNRKDR